MANHPAAVILAIKAQLKKEQELISDLEPDLESAELEAVRLRADYEKAKVRRDDLIAFLSDLTHPTEGES